MGRAKRMWLVLGGESSIVGVGIVCSGVLLSFSILGKGGESLSAASSSSSLGSKNAVLRWRRRGEGRVSPFMAGGDVSMDEDVDSSFAGAAG